MKLGSRLNVTKKVTCFADVLMACLKRNGNLRDSRKLACSFTYLKIMNGRPTVSRLCLTDKKTFQVHLGPKYYTSNTSATTADRHSFYSIERSLWTIGTFMVYGTWFMSWWSRDLFLWFHWWNMKGGYVWCCCSNKRMLSEADLKQI